MIQWLLDLGVSYDTLAVRFGVSYNTIVVIIDTLSPGDFNMRGCFFHTEGVL